MNKVFRVIWSEAHGAWVAVSEMTKSHSKRSRKSALALALTAGSLMTISGAAVATGTFVPAGDASVAITSGTCKLETAADGENSVSIGCGAGAGAAGKYPGSKADSDTSIGYQAGIGVKGKENTAIGSNAGESVEGDENTAFGVSAGKLVTGSKNVSLGFNSGFKLNGNSNISAGDASGGSIHGDNNVMLGTAAKVKGSAADNRISDTVLIGTKASASSSDNVAIGKDTQATHANSVALGHASVTSEAVQVTEGIITDSNKVEHTYDGFAGTASGVVSVGVKGAERQIINVAPGAITSSSTDAVNGSQLYGVAKGLNDQINNLDLGGGWVLGSKAADGTTDQDLTIATGKKVDFNAGKNMEITSEQDADGNVVSTFKTKDDVAFTSVTTGGTVMNDNGLTITNGPSITKTGINAGDLNITNVKAGIADTDGVNVSQLQGVANVIGGVTVDANGNYTGPTFKVNNTTNTTIAGAIAELDKGWTFTAGGETDQVQAGDKVSLEAGKNMLITSTKDADGNITSTFLTKDAVEFDSVKTGDSLLNNTGLTVGTNVSVTSQGFTAGDVSLTVDGINAGDLNITNVKAGIEDTHGVNVSQLKGLGSVIGDITIDNSTGAVTGPTFIVNGEDQGTVSGAITKLDEGWTLSDGTKTQNVKAGDTATIKAGDNMDVTIDDVTGEMIVKTKADVKFNTVTTGDTVMNTDGLTVGAAGGNQATITNQGFKTGDVVINHNSINAGGNKINNVQAGTEQMDAVNVSQLETVAATAGQGWYLKVNGVEADSANVAPGETMGLTAGKNMVLTQTGTSVEFATKVDVEFDSVTTGDTVMNTDGVTVGAAGGNQATITNQGFKTGDVVINHNSINAGGNQINNVAAGTELTDGVNVSQLKGLGSVIGDITIDNSTGAVTGPTFNVNNTENTTIAGAIAELDKGWTLSDGDKSKQIKAGDTAIIKAGDNMDVAIDDVTGEMIVKTQADVKFDSVTLGDITQPGQYTQLTQGGLNIGGNTFVNNGGLTFNNSSVSVSANGINAGGNKIINVAKGEDDSDAVNVGQLKDYVGKNDGSWNISDGTTSSKVETGNTVTIAGSQTGTTAGNINVTHDGNGNLTIESNANVKHDNVTVGDTTINKDTGITVGDVSITTGGINAGGNQIKDVADGTELTDGVNLGQLKGVEDKVNKGWNVSTNGGSTNAINGGKTENVAPDAGVDFSGGKNIVVSQDGTDITISTADDVEFDDVKVGDVTINKDTGITVGDVSITAGGINAGDKKITGVADGTIAAGSKDAVNGGQIHDLEQKISEAGGWELSDGTTDKKVNSGDKVTIKGGDNIDVAINDDGDMIVKTNPDVTHDSVTTGDTVMNDNGVTIKDGPSITKKGVDAGGKKVTGVADGDINKDSTDAVNGSQLDATNNRVTKNEGDITNLDNRVTKTEGDITNLDNRVTKTEGDITNLDNRVTKNEGDITNLDNRVTKNEGDITNLDNRVTKNEGDIENNAGDIENIQNGKDGMFQVSQDYNAPKPKPTGKKSAAGGAGAVASGDNSTAVGNDAQATASNSTALGNSAFASANNSVALGQGSVADRENSVSVGTAGAERQITNVAAGVAPTDAVNVSQLDALGSKVNQYFNAANKRIDKVDNNARAGIAAAMAAGTLPQSTLPGKSMVTVGASTYRGESALAIGVSRLSDNARTVIKANASADSRGNAGAAVGAGWHW